MENRKIMMLDNVEGMMALALAAAMSSRMSRAKDSQPTAQKEQIPEPPKPPMSRPQHGGTFTVIGDSKETWQEAFADIWAKI